MIYSPGIHFVFIWMNVNKAWKQGFIIFCPASEPNFLCTPGEILNLSRAAFMPPWVLPRCKTKQHWPLYVALREKQTTTWEQQASSARNMNEKVVCQHAWGKKYSWVMAALGLVDLLFQPKGLKMDLKNKNATQNYDPTCCLHLAQHIH